MEEGPKILLVDDESNVLEAFRRQLAFDYDIDTAQSAERALALLQDQGPYSVIISDMRMPGMDGIELLTRVSRVHPDTVRIMLTGNSDLIVATKAVNEGSVFRFLTKPCSSDALTVALKDAVAHHDALLADREIRDKTLAATIKVLSDIVAVMSPEGFAEALAMRPRIRRLAQAKQLRKIWEIELAAVLSELGASVVAPDILVKVKKEEPLTEREEEAVLRIPELGWNLVTKLPRLGNVAEIILYQRKNFDGTGFPGNYVAYEQIPIGARIIRVVRDVHRLESKGASLEEAVKSLHLIRNRYDPELLHLLLSEGEQLAHESTRPRPREVCFSELKENQVAEADICTADGVCLVPTGTVLTRELINRVSNYHKLVGLQLPLVVRDAEQ